MQRLWVWEKNSKKIPSEFNLVRKKVKPNDFSSVVEKFSECDVNEKPWYLQENKTQYFGSKCTPC